MSRQDVTGFVALWALSSAGAAVAGDLEKAPPPFGFRTGSAVAIDMETVDIDMTFDADTGRATGRAHVVFRSGAAGMPFFDLVPTPTAIKLDGDDVAVGDFAVVSAPGGETRLRVLARQIAADSQHTVDLEYSIPDVTFASGSVRAGFFMNDLATGGREFFEQYGPANLEFDQVRYTFNVRIEGTSTEHEIFTNGEVTADGDGAWTVGFPAYFTASSIFFHLSEKNRFNVQRYTFDGLEADIPVTVYSSSNSLTASGVSRSRAVLAELEQTYGAFAHPRVVIYVTSTGGGMEYGGATMTTTGALGHELTHSYFARGVMPADGNAGWIDEAIASWRDDGYPRGGTPSGNPVNLGGFTAYRRHTTQAAYTSGAALISDFDYLFRGNGGMKSVLRQLFAERRLTTITVPFFQDFLERVGGQDLAAIFRRYVYGRSRAGAFVAVAPERFGAELPRTSHPRPYSRAEIELYR